VSKILSSASKWMRGMVALPSAGSCTSSGAIVRRWKPGSGESASIMAVLLRPACSLPNSDPRRRVRDIKNNLK